MATGTINSTEYAAQNNAGNALTGAATRASGRDVGGEVLYLVASATTTAIDAGSTINVGIIPAGARVIPALSYVVHGAVGTSVTFDIGDSADPNRYADGLDVAAAGTTQFDIHLTSEYTTLSTTNTIICTTADATMDADIELLFIVAYRVIR